MTHQKVKFCPKKSRFWLQNILIKIAKIHILRQIKNEQKIEFCHNVCNVNLLDLLGFQMVRTMTLKLSSHFKLMGPPYIARHFTNSPRTCKLQWIERFTQKGVSRICLWITFPFLLCFRVVWKSLLVLYAKDVLTDLVTIHHGQPRWQYCTQVSSTLFGEAIARLYLASMSSISRANIDKEVSIFQSFSSEILHCIS